jgi:hypothetical protein
MQRFPQAECQVGMRTLLVILLSTLIFSCRKSDSRSTQAPGDTSLIGIWAWVEQYDLGITSGNYVASNVVQTPANTGIQEVLFMGKDSTWTLSRNGDMIRSGTYTILTWDTPGGPIPELTFIPSGGADSIVNHWLSANGDTLVINNPQVDTVSVARVYVRENGGTTPP